RCETAFRCCSKRSPSTGNSFRTEAATPGSGRTGPRRPGRDLRAATAGRGMKLAPEQLATDLAKGLRPVYLVSSDEPLLADEAIDAIRNAARQAGITERESHVADKSFDWSAVAESLRSLSLFAAGKLVEVRLPNGTPGDAGSRAI